MSGIPDTPGLPSILLNPLRKLLIDCLQDITQQDLRGGIFSHAKLQPFKDRLPIMGVVAMSGYANRLIGYLRNQYLDTYENALTIFLNVLAETMDEGNYQRKQLEILAREWESYRSLPRSNPMSTTIGEEANPQQSQMLYMADAEKMLNMARAVAYVKLRRFRRGQASGDSTGTAWLLVPTLALTCWHVIEALQRPFETSIAQADLQAQIDNTLLTFDYLSSGNGIEYKIDSVLYPQMTPRKLDYVLMRLQNRDDHPLQARGYLRFDVDAPLTQQTSLYIFQHPLGQPQQGSGDTYVSPDPTEYRILYKTPTEPGTSGAPVFNRANWRAVALHNGENKNANLREGTLLKAILDELQRELPSIYDEIMDAQKKE